MGGPHKDLLDERDHIGQYHSNIGLISILTETQPDFDGFSQKLFVVKELANGKKHP
jgi:hypothetical protein